MSIGERIKRYRILRKKSQKQLGIEMGFPEKSADVRVAQYESDRTAPIPEIRNRFAKVLEVDPSALDEFEPQKRSDLYRLFLYLEELFGMTLERTKDKTFLVFDNQEIAPSGLDSFSKYPVPPGIVSYMTK